MSITASSSENEGPIASWTRSRHVESSAQPRLWCNRTCTTRELNESSSSNSTLSLADSYSETEFPAFPETPIMDNREARPLPLDVLELLTEMTEHLHAHEGRVQGVYCFYNL